MTRRSLLVTTLFAFVTLAGIAAQESGAPPEGRGHRGRGGPFANLNLSQQQQEQLRTLMQEQREDKEFQQLRNLQRQLHQAIFADSPDLGAIEQLKAQIATAEANALTARVQHQLKVAQILTPEQRQQMRSRPGPGGPGGGRGPRHR